MAFGNALIWVVWLSALAWTTSKCEPPVNSYLPPGNGQSSRPSSQYGPPSSNNGPSGSSGFQGSGNYNKQNGFSSSVQSGRSSSLDTKYGVPSSQNFAQGPVGSQNGFNSQPQHNQGQGNRSPFNGGNGSNGRGTLQSTYESPGGTQNSNGVASGSGSSAYAQAETGFGQRPETSYGPPPVGGIQASSNGFGSQSSNQRSEAQRVPDSTYGTPNTGGFNGRNSGNGSPSSSYDTPGFGSSSGGNGGEVGGRGYDSHGQNGDGGESDEPAKYEFSYEVDDAQTGTKFGHSEQRDGDLAQGEYNVVLPDGRKQVVEYEAGLQGYKPQIRYEGGQDGSQGYMQGGPNGFPGNNNGADTSAQYQDQNNGLNQRSKEYQSGQLRSQQDAGYPRGGPNNNGKNGNGNGRGSNGFSDQNGSNLQSESLGYPSGRPGHGNGVENLNDNNGYSSGSSQNSNNAFSNGAHRGNGNGGSFSNGGRQNGNKGHSNASGGTEGYPSGGPNGRRGSGY